MALRYDLRRLQFDSDCLFCGADISLTGYAEMFYIYIQYEWLMQLAITL
jgi:hypothetical protein